MTHKYLLTAVFLAANLSGVASATVNQANSQATIDLSNAVMTNISGSANLFGSFTYLIGATNVFEHTVSALPQSMTSPIGLTLSVSGAGSQSSASTTGAVLSTQSLATSGTTWGSASGSLNFSVTGVGKVLLQVPYTLLAAAGSSDINVWYGGSTAQVTGNGFTNSTKTKSATSADDLSADTTPIEMFTNADTLDFTISNTTVGVSNYMMAFNAYTTAQYTAPVPEIPAPLMLSLGLLPLLLRRGRKFMRMANR